MFFYSGGSSQLVLFLLLVYYFSGVSFFYGVLFLPFVSIKRWFRRARASRAVPVGAIRAPVACRARAIDNSIIYLHTVLEDVRTKSLCVETD